MIKVGVICMKLKFDQVPQPSGIGHRKAVSHQKLIRLLSLFLLKTV